MNDIREKAAEIMKDPAVTTDGAYRAANIEFMRSLVDELSGDDKKRCLVTVENLEAQRYSVPVA